MKKLFLLSIAAGAGLSAMAQIRGGDNYFASKLVVDLNFPVGVVMQSPTSSMPVNFTSALNTRIDELKMSSGLSMGVDLGVGYYFGKKRQFGVGAGIQYLTQSSDATIGAYHVEYKDYDSKDNVYRQLVTATHSIKEQIDITQINIPIVLKYKHRFNTRVGIAVDAGIVYNLQMQNKWKTDAEFNYEAIYKFGRDANGNTYTVYEDQPVPDKANGWLLTKAQYDRTNSMGTVDGVFDSLRARGYNVGLNLKPANNSGTISYTTGSIGFILRPTVTYRLANRIHLNVGLCAMYQTFENKTVSNYRLIDNMGSTYSSMLNTVSSTNNITASLNLGLRFLLGTPKDAQFDGKFDY